MAAQLWRLANLLVAVVAAPALATATSSSSSPDNTNLRTSDAAAAAAAARLRGPEIFNAVHHAMRQWGSSLHHNGMSFYLATVPEGVLLHHGTHSPDAPTEPDWLAYEIEHAENFARSPPHGPPGGGGGRGGGGDDDDAVEPEPWWSSDYQTVIGAAKPDEPRPPPLGDEETTAHGYLHTYKTTRPLQFLYIDGMSGGKTSMGTLDSQDYLLRGQNASTVVAAQQQQPSADKPPKGPKGGPHVNKKEKRKGRGKGPMGEQERASDLCALCKEWDLQGVIRMEAGFEIIKCDFSDGLEAVQVLQRPDGIPGPPGRGRGGEGPPDGGRPRRTWSTNNVEYARGLSERYQGIGAARTLIDYSSMVSAFFYPAVNLSNPDPKRPDLPRLSSASAADLARIKRDLGAVIAEQQRSSSSGRSRPSPLSSGTSTSTTSVDWQGVSDMIVGRYADRIQFMAEKIDSAEKMRQMVDFLLTLFIDYSDKAAARKPSEPAAAVRRCRDFYLSTVRPSTEADRLIKAGFEVVTNRICTALFAVRDQLTPEPEPEPEPETRSAPLLPMGGGAGSAAAAKAILHDLMKFLRWTRFKRCPACDVSEVCVIPMWPMGTVEEYYSPRCTDGSEEEEDGVPYWERGYGQQGGPGGKPPLES